MENVVTFHFPQPADIPELACFFAFTNICKIFTCCNASQQLLHGVSSAHKNIDCERLREVLDPWPSVNFEFAQLEFNRVVRPCRLLSRHSNRMSADLMPSILRVKPFPDVFINALEVYVLFLRSLEIELIVKVICRLNELVLSVPKQQVSQLSFRVDLPRIVTQNDACLVKLWLG